MKSRPSVSYKKFLNKHLENPKFRKMYEAEARKMEMELKRRKSRQSK